MQSRCTALRLSTAAKDGKWCRETPKSRYFSRQPCLWSSQKTLKITEKPKYHQKLVGGGILYRNFHTQQICFPRTAELKKTPLQPKKQPLQFQKPPKTKNQKALVKTRNARFSACYPKTAWRLRSLLLLLCLICTQALTLR